MNSLTSTIQNHPGSNRCVIVLSGSLISTDAIQLKNQLCKNKHQFGKKLTIDLSRVQEADLTGLNSLLVSKQNFKRAGKTLSIRIPENSPIQPYVQLTKFETFLNIA